jgi:hypothetical protein
MRACEAAFQTLSTAQSPRAATYSAGWCRTALRLGGIPRKTSRAAER